MEKQEISSSHINLLVTLDYNYLAPLTAMLAFLYLPDNVEKCLYLDPDIYILKPLLPLYDIDMEDTYIAAAGHMHGIANVINKTRLGCTEQKRYFNSGIMLMNLATIRRDFTLEKVLVTVLK